MLTPGFVPVISRGLKIGFRMLKKKAFLGKELVNVVLPAKLSQKEITNRNHTLKSVLCLVTISTMQLSTLNNSPCLIIIFLSPKKKEQKNEEEVEEMPNLLRSLLKWKESTVGIQKWQESASKDS